MLKEYLIIGLKTIERWCFNILNRRKYTDSEIKKIIKNMVILVDSREKKNENILSYLDKHKIKYEIMALPSGDYSFALEPIPELDLPHKMFFFDDIIIEKKNSLEELSGNFTQERERFNDEFIRCKAKHKYLLIENSSYKDLIEGKYNTKYNSKSFLGSLHSFNIRYQLEVVFMPEKELTPIFILATLQYYLRNITK